MILGLAPVSMGLVHPGANTGTKAHHLAPFNVTSRERRISVLAYEAPRRRSMNGQIACQLLWSLELGHVSAKAAFGCAADECMICGRFADIYVDEAGW